MGGNSVHINIRIEVPDHAVPEQVCKLLDHLKESVQSDDVEHFDADWMDEDGDTHYWNP